MTRRMESPKPALHTLDPSAWDPHILARHFAAIRSFTLTLCEPLGPEDMVVQSMEAASPTKWHLAHSTWFFETFVLQQFDSNYQALHPKYNYLFNSYYNAMGDRHPRPRRGLITRPTLREVMDYRHHVDEHVTALLETCPDEKLQKIGTVLELGLHHEQQHQELILTDIKHLLSSNALKPAYREGKLEESATDRDLNWIEFPEGVRAIGYSGDRFAYDNESPRHQVYLNRFALAERLITNEEYLEFINDGGYERSELWLDLGWTTEQNDNWSGPKYWRKDGDTWLHFTLTGEQELNPTAPVSHVSYFEADAFARWRGERLATEAEWETVCMTQKVMPRVDDNFAESMRFEPQPAADSNGNRLRQLFGDLWEWTQSPYTPYPGYQPPAGALGEYNGKFMCNQYVLRGGSCATPRLHIRPTYRNFFPPHTRWQFAGIRLARDISS